MSNLIEGALGVLNAFRSEVSTWTNQGLLTSIDGHIAQIENAVAQDVHAGETAVKAVLADLYGAFHGHVAAPAPIEATPVPAAPVAEPTPAPVAPAAPAATPVAADPTPAPSTTTEASSAPSSTPSASTPETPAASA